MKIHSGLLGVAILQVAGVCYAVDPGELPTGERIASGDAVVSRQGDRMTVEQTSGVAQIDWNTFNVGSAAAVSFRQPDSTSVSYNKVTGGQVSEIQGALESNGRVFISNPNGVLFTKSAKVNVGSLLATTKEGRTYGGSMRFQGPSTASVVNEGEVRTKDGAVFFADSVRNDGTVESTGLPEVVPVVSGGKVVSTKTVDRNVTMGGGAGMTVKFDTFNAVLTPGDAKVLVENNGIVKSNGAAYLTAKAKETAEGMLVNNNGLVEADSVRIEGGRIVLGPSSRVRYGKNGDSGAKLEIVQSTTSSDAGVAIGGEIVSSFDAAKAKAGVDEHNARIDRDPFVDKDGKTYYVDSNNKVGLATKEGDAYVNDAGEKFINSDKGEFVVSSSVFTDHQTSTGSNGKKVDVLNRSNGNIITISYEKNGDKFENVKVIPGKIELDPVNAKLVEMIREKLDKNETEILDYKSYAKWVAPLYKQIKEEFKNSMPLTPEQKSLLVDAHVVEGTKIRKPMLENIKKVAEQIGKPYKDVRALAGLLKYELSMETGMYQQNAKKGFFNAAGVEMKLVKLDGNLKKTLKKTLVTPLTTISVKGPVDIVDAAFKSDSGPHNVAVILDSSKGPDVKVRNSVFDLGGGGFGVGRMDGVDAKLDYTTSAIDQATGEVKITATDFYDEYKGVLSGLTSKISKTYNDYDTMAMGKKGSEDVTFVQFLDMVKNDSGLPKEVDFVNRRLSDVYKDMMKKVGEKNGVTLSDKFDAIYDQAVTYEYLAAPLGAYPINIKDIRIQAEQVPGSVAGAQAGKYPTYNVDIDGATMVNTSEFALTGGFGAVKINALKTDGNVGTYIHGGNTRLYTKPGSSNKETAYEYGVYNIVERIKRSENADAENRWHSDKEHLIPIETSAAFDSWYVSKAQTREHLPDTSITITDSDLKNVDGFTHLMAKNIEITNTKIDATFSRDLSKDKYMKFVPKLGINGDNVVLDNSHVRIDGAKKTGVSPKAGFFFVGNMLGKNESSIFVKTHQGAAMLTNGDVVLKGETKPEDLKITLINTGPKAKPDGADLGASNDDADLNNVAFNAGDVVKGDENHNYAGGTTVKLDNVKVEAYAINGGVAYTSNKKSGSIEVGDNATFDYYELPREVALVKDQLGGKGGSRLDTAQVDARIKPYGLHATPMPSSGSGTGGTPGAGTGSGTGTGPGAGGNSAIGGSSHSSPGSNATAGNGSAGSKTGAKADSFIDRVSAKAVAGSDPKDDDAVDKSAGNNGRPAPLSPFAYVRDKAYKLDDLEKSVNITICSDDEEECRNLAMGDMTRDAQVSVGEIE